MGYLTTHVLDTTQGIAAQGVTIELYALAEDDSRSLLGQRITNEDGRCDAPLLEGQSFRAGRYELTFAVGQYFSQQGVELSAPPFLDVVVIRFGLADENSHYHVPLLVSPYAYSTYRGS